MNEVQSKDLDTTQQKKIPQHLIHDCTLACNDFQSKGFNLAKAKEITAEKLATIGTMDGMQSMLMAQMLSIHQLQQKSMTYAHSIGDFRLQKHYTNAAVKLSNCFVQQANILARLQGVGSQKIIVERVEVHQGGQAIVGNVQGGLANKEKK
ncbi:MAG: hypothetical protein A3E88_04275 [Legionellales bacterium RIFCSPHIGHO2_12_FULL_35_11]|nr:MAG: hypothetical protein A3E88_04275 [Legionellales bacterium RIFCSPHIGHO2_12_FULL_35_11]